MNIIKKILPFKYKRSVKEKLGVPSLHWSLQNLKRKNFYPATVVDIGAYEGFWTQDLLEVFPGAKVLMVEAQLHKESFLKTVKQKNPTVEYAISLLSAVDGETKLFAQNETASHVVAAAVPGQQYQQIKTQTLDALLESLHFPFPDFLKLDVQGHEMEVLKGAVKSLEYATICLLEISILNLGDDGPLMAEMIRFM